MISNPPYSYAEETEAVRQDEAEAHRQLQEAADEEEPALSFSEGEILEIEELAKPEEGAFFKIKLLATGEMITLFVDKDRSLLWTMTGRVELADVVPGVKISYIHRYVKDHEEPMIVFAKISNPNY